MWVQLLQPRAIEGAGKSRIYHAGDWVDVGNQSAQRWIADGIARSVRPFDSEDLSGGGIVLRGDPDKRGKLSATFKTLPVELSAALTSLATPLPFAKTLIWDTALVLRPELVTVGMRLLQTWEVAAPLASYEELAQGIGSVEARARTQAVVRDMRVPVYDPRLVFVRRCRAGEALLEAWNEERATGDDERLCLLRALYRVKPLLCALPVSWIAKAQ